MYDFIVLLLNIYIIYTETFNATSHYILQTENFFGILISTRLIIDITSAVLPVGMKD